MKILHVAVALAASLSAALSGLLLADAHDLGAAAPSRAVDALDAFALADRSLQRDMLDARSGLLRDYDPLTASVERDAHALADLRRLAKADSALTTTIAELAATTAERDDLVERFKSDNALMQNSLSRFSTLARSAASRQAWDVESSMLQLTLDTGADSAAAARRSLISYARMHPAGGGGGGGELYAHGRLLARVLPEIDDTLSQYPQARLEAEVARLRALTADWAGAEAARSHARRSTLIGLLIAAALSAAAAAAALRMQDQRRRREAVSEHLSAIVSRLLVDVRAHDLASRIEHALERLGRHVGADQAVLRLGARQAGDFTWARTGALDATALERLLARHPSAAPWPGDVLHLRSPSLGPERSPSKDLSGTGLGAVLAVRTQMAGQEATLGFGSLRAKLKLHAGGEAGLKLALSALVQAVHRDELEAQARRMAQRKAHTRRMEAIGGMASGVAHNFNNIICAIGGFSETAELYVEPQSAVGDNLEEIRRAVQRARDLVEELLRFGRVPRSPPQPFSLYDVVREAARLLRAASGPNIRFTFEAKKECRSSYACGHASLFQQAVLNVGRNAVEVTPAGGCVEIMMDIRAFTAADVARSAELQVGRYGVVSIRDQGGGISSDDLEKIFDPFFTTRAEGTGLGLSTSREIIHDHGGVIMVAESTRLGTHIEILVPLVQS